MFRAAIFVRPAPARAITLLVILTAGCLPLSADTQTRAAPDDHELVALGETIEFGDGHSITVSRYEENVPYEAQTPMGPSAGIVNLWFAKICAGDSELENFVSEIYFSANQGTVGGRISGQGHIVPGIRQPRFNEGYVPTSPAAGTCVEGWVVAGPTTAKEVLPDATAICFDSARIGVVGEDLQVKFAWRLPIDD